MGKKYKYVILFVVSTIVLGLIIILYRAFYKKPTVYTDVEKYKNGEYKNYYLGECAQEFLPDYSSLKDFNSIEFNVFDGRSVSTPFKAYITNYNLDVHYTPKQFAIEFNNLINSYDCFKESSIRPNKEFDIYIIRTEFENINKKHIAFFGMDAENSIVRYGIYFYSPDKRTDFALEEALYRYMIRSSPVDW